jgi:hypothetical protein
MYPKLIFDVDYTLYNSKDIPKEESETEDITEKFYSLFAPKVKLIKLLQEYKGEIYLFSNGNLCHIQEVIDKTNLSSIFKKEHIATLDNYLDKPKPYVKAYKYVITAFNIKDDDIVYFFEDNLDNLKTAKKKYNWKTIFIDEDKTTTKKLSHYSFVDYTFKNINVALEYLINKIDKQQARAQNKLNKQNKHTVNKLRSPKMSPRRKRVRSRRKIDKRFAKSNNHMNANRMNRMNRMKNQHNIVDNYGTNSTSENIIRQQ